MNLDFLDVLSQSNQKHREQVGTAGTGGIHANLNVPSTNPATGNSGNEILAPTASAETSSQVFPVYSQNMGTEMPNVDAAVPAVPGVPKENDPICNVITDEVANCETATSDVTGWLGARCAWLQGLWGSAKSLYQDYREWCSEYKRPPCSRELFSTILNEWFQRDSDGWQGLCIAADWCLSQCNTGNQSDVRHPGTRRIQ